MRRKTKDNSNIYLITNHGVRSPMTAKLITIKHMTEKMKLGCHSEMTK